MRGFIAGILAMVLLVVCAAFVIIHFGLLPLGADNAPGAFEKRLAHAATDAYLGRNAPHQPNPYPPTVENLTEGAQKYEAHCAVCHGGAANRISPLQNKFSPPVPQLVNQVPHDPDGEFWLITKHGYRLTGMPAWDGILSDGDMWKIITFVKHTDSLPAQVQAAWRAAAGLPPKHK